VLFETETWPLIRKEESRLEMFENRVFKRISESMEEEIGGGWR
jgi:hypothetical protein